MSAKETQISSAEIYKGHIINVYKDDISIEGGGNSIREVVRHKGAAAVLAVDEKGEAFFVEQFRYPIGRPLFEVPAGKITREGGYGHQNAALPLRFHRFSPCRGESEKENKMSFSFNW